MASNALVDIFRIKDLRQRIFFTIGCLVVFRVGAFLSLPGINAGALKEYFAAASSAGGITDYLDFFAGGAFKNFSLFMLGVMPYISTQIIMQLLLVIFPALKEIAQSDGGQKKIAFWTRIATVGVAVVQSFAMVAYARTIARTNPDILTISPQLYTMLAILSVATGSLFLVWIGEQITKRGIGNGVSMIIFAGIVARLPNALFALGQKIAGGEINPIFAVVVLLLFVLVVFLVVYEQQGMRKIPVNYAKRVVGRRMYGAQNSYIPFKINPSGVIPVIFASSLLTFPLQIAQSMGGGAKWLRDFAHFLRPEGWAYNILYVLLIVFFAYFYTQVSMNPGEISKNIRENGGSIPGIRSEKMEDYLTKILNRLVFPGALYLAMIALIPTIIQRIFHFPSELSYLLGGTSLLILVGVDLDTMNQIEAQMKMHHHEGLTRKGKTKSRKL